MTIKRNVETPESRAFWEECEKMARITRKWPAWMKGGINLCPSRYQYGTPNCPCELCKANKEKS